METDTSELAIEREADLRARKKKILQRLKNSSTKVDELRGNIAGAEGSLFKQEFSSGSHRKESVLTARESLELFEGFANNQVISDDEAATEYEDSSREKLDKSANKSPVPPRRSRTYIKEDSAISIVFENTEGTQYVPSFASSSSQQSHSLSDYERKTSEIRRKAEERRKNIMSPRSRSPNTLDVPFVEEDDHLEIMNGPTRSSSLTDLSQTSRTKEFHSTEKSFQCRRRMSERSVTLSRAEVYSYSARSGLSSSSEDINYFARRQQEKLEDNLRRVERNLENTFGEMRKYIAAAQIETTKHLEKDQLETS